MKPSVRCSPFAPSSPPAASLSSAITRSSAQSERDLTAPSGRARNPRPREPAGAGRSPGNHGVRNRAPAGYYLVNETGGRRMQAQVKLEHALVAVEREHDVHTMLELPRPSPYGGVAADRSGCGHQVGADDCGSFEPDDHAAALRPFARFPRFRGCHQVRPRHHTGTNGPNRCPVRQQILPISRTF
jgi:hypothetical protein